MTSTKPNNGYRAENFRTITMKSADHAAELCFFNGFIGLRRCGTRGFLTALLQYQDGNLSIFGVILFILLSSEFFHSVYAYSVLSSHVAMNGQGGFRENLYAVRYAGRRKQKCGGFSG